MAHPHLRSGSDKKGCATTAKRLLGNGIAALLVSASLIAPAQALNEGAICNNGPRTMQAHYDAEVAIGLVAWVRINVTHANTRGNVYGSWRRIAPGASIAHAQNFTFAAGSGIWYAWTEIFVENNGFHKVAVRYVPVLAGGADFATVQYACRF